MWEWIFALAMLMVVLYLLFTVSEIRSNVNDLREDYEDTQVGQLEKEKALEKKLETFVSQEDKAFQVSLKVLEDAIKEGEGLFLVRRIEDGTYLWKINHSEILRKGPKTSS
jgi:hypothetical protein